MFLIIVGCLLLLSSPVLLGFSRKAGKDAEALQRTGTTPVPRLDALRRTTGDAAFRQRTAVSGVVEPPSSPLVSHLSEVPCAWYRFEVHERYLKKVPGPSYKNMFTELVAEHSSSDRITIRDDHNGRITVELDGLADSRPEGAELAYRQEETEPPATYGIQARPATHDGERCGYEYREWVVHPGQRVHVLGEARGRDGALVIGKPSDGSKFLVAIGTREDLQEKRAGERRASIGCFVVLVAVGVALIAAGVVL